VAERNTIRELLVKLGVEVDDKGLKNFDSALGDIKGAMGDVLGVAKTVAAGIGIAMGAIGATVLTTASTFDDVAKAAQRLGLAVEPFQELAKAAELSGAEMGDLETGFRRMAQTLVEASKGSTAQADALRDIGLAAADLVDLAPEESFQRIADGLLTLEEGHKRTAAAQEIFGRGGSKLLPLLNQGAAGIEEMRRQARELGIVFNQEATAAGEEFIDRLADAKDAVGGLKNAIGVELMPVLTEMLTGFREWFVANRDLIQQRIEKWTDRVVAGIRLVQRVVVGADRVVRDTIGGWAPIVLGIGAAFTAAAGVIAGAQITLWVIKLTEALAVALEVVLPVVAAISSIGAAEIVAAIAAAAAAITLIALAVQDVMVFLRGGDSVLGHFLSQVEGFDGLTDKAGDLRKAAGELAAAFGHLWESTAPLRAVLVDLVQAGLQLVINGLANLAGIAVPEVGTALDGLIFIVESATAGVDALAGGFERLDDNADRISKTIGRVKAAIAALQDQIMSGPGFELLAGGLGGGFSSAVASQIPGANLVRSITSATNTTNNASSTSNTFGGDTNSVTVNGGGGMNEAQLEQVLQRESRAKARRTSAALTGAAI